MSSNSSSVSMTSGPIWKRIIFFAIPLFFGNLFQQLYNTADSLIVGRFLGSTALAAVSSSGNLIFLMVGFFNGLAIGAGVVVAKYYGAKRYHIVQRTIHTIMALGLICGVVLTFIGVLAAPQILVLMGTPSEVLPNSITYFRIYFCGSLAFVMYNFMVGILQSVGDSRHPLIYLVISSIVNIVLDLLFVGVFHWGVGSAALATIISQFISAFLCLVLLDAQAMRDLGWFGSLTLVGTILFVLVCLPVFLQRRRAVRSPGKSLPFSRWSLPRGGRANRIVLLGVIVLTGVFAYFSRGTSFDSDMQHINYMTPGQRADLKFLSSSLQGRGDSLQLLYAVAEGRTPDEALRRNEALVAALTDVPGVDKVTGVSGFLLSDSLRVRREVRWNAFWKRHEGTAGALERAAAEAGFAPGAFRPFTDRIRGEGISAPEAPEETPLHALAGKRFLIPKTDPLILGRNRDLCNVVFPNTPGVSGKHCAVWFKHDKLFLQDLGSTHGTFLKNGAKLFPNQPIELQVGDSFYLGSPLEAFVIAEKRGS